MHEQNNDDVREKLGSRLQALFLGGQDMVDVANTVKYLVENFADLNPSTKRVLEAGLTVTYARPFLPADKKSLPQLNRASNLADDLLDSHNQLIKRRNADYAHTDQEGSRRFSKFSQHDLDQWVSGQGELSHEWDSPTTRMLDDIIILTEKNLQKFCSEIASIKGRLAQMSET